MAYGTVKVDNITFDQGGADQNVTASGIYRAITSGVTVSGTIAGAVLIGTTTVSGTTVTGTTANFASGVFTTQVSGLTVTGTQSSFTSGNFVTLSGATATFTSGVIASGTAAAPSLSILGDANTGIYSPGADQVAISTNGTGRLFVDAGGNIGVGMTPVDVAGFNSIQLSDTNGTNLDFYTSSTHQARIISLPGDLRINQITSGTLGFWTNNTERARIDSSGNVGIGTTVLPGNKVTVGTGNATADSSIVKFNTANANVTALTLSNWDGTSTIYGPRISFDNSGRGAFIIGGSDAANNFDICRIWGTPDLRIDSSGRVGIGTSNPGSALEINAAAATSPFIAKINTAEAARIDSYGRLLVGISGARSTFYSTASAFIQLEGGAINGAESLSITRNVNDIYGGSLILAKTRGAGDTIVTSGDTIGNVTWQGNDGSKFVQAARIEAQVDGTPGANDMPGRLVFFTTADGQSTPTERMRIDALGALKTSTNGTYKFSAGTTEITHNDATSSIQLTASSTSFTGDAVTISTYRNTVNDSYKFLSCTRQGFAVALEIRDDGDVYNVNGTYGSFSDAKLKENIIDAQSQWDDIRQLRVRNYNFKPETNNSTHKQIGVIAQEIENVSPGLVNTVSDRDAEGNDLGTVTKSVNYSVLYMKAVKALQEAMERIETLEARLTAAGIE